MWLLIGFFSAVFINRRLKSKSTKKKYRFFKIFSILLLLSLITGLKAQTYSIKGEIKCPEKGDLYLFLVDKQTFKTPFNGTNTLVIKITHKSKPFFFEFKNIPPGRYGIRGYIDQNGNQKLDKGLFGPLEPWVMSWQDGKRFPVSFTDIAFQLNSNKNLELTFN